MQKSITISLSNHVDSEMLLSIADGMDQFPLVMVGGVLEANKRWDIGKEVIDCISKVYSGTRPVRPKVGKL